MTLMAERSRTSFSDTIAAYGPGTWLFREHRICDKAVIASMHRSRLFCSKTDRCDRSVLMTRPAPNYKQRFAIPREETRGD